MNSLNQQQKIFLATASFLILLVMVGILVVISRYGNGQDGLKTPDKDIIEPAYTVKPTNEPLASSTPGVQIYGRVHDQSGVGVKDVVIYRNYASYPGKVIATTDANGDYKSNFYEIPGDEMIGLWAEKPGLKFDPENYRWRHYYGYERVERDFLAYPP